MFDTTSGVLLDTLNNPTPQDSESFELFSSVAIAGNTIVVGAAGDNTGAPYAGSAYIFSLVDADFNDDGSYDCLDIDALVAEIAAGNHNPLFDLTGDGLVNLGDRDAWLTQAGEINLGPGRVFLVGDATLDGFVDVQDFNEWNANRFTIGAAWCRGDFNADGVIDVQDFNMLEQQQVSNE